jgi:hypothetical protein
VARSANISVSRKETHPKRRVLDTFRVKNVVSDRRWLFVEVKVFRSKKIFQQCAIGKVTKRGPVASFHGEQDGYRIIYPKGEIGTINLWPSPKMDMYAMHEAVHAAFAFSRRCKWKSDERDREEFIARCAEWIYEHMRMRFIQEGWYKNDLHSLS